MPTLWLFQGTGMRLGRRVDRPVHVNTPCHVLVTALAACLLGSTNSQVLQLIKEAFISTLKAGESLSR